jgi:pentatricopeptide repeat protein
MSWLPTTPEAYTFYLQLLDAAMPLEVRQFSMLMRNFVRLRELLSACTLFNEMWRGNLQPTMVSINTWIRGMCRVHNLEFSTV